MKKNLLWKYRIVVVLLGILLVQVPFVFFKLTTTERDSAYAVVEAAHVLVSSGLAGYLFSKTFESFLENRLYGRFRRDWKEVRVMYSDFAGRGEGETYPREPTLLIQAPIGGDFGPKAPWHEAEDVLFARSLDGSSRNITASIIHGPLSISFNTGYVGRPAADETTWVTSHWSELQLMQVGPFKLTRAGFPDTLTTLGRART